jgi:hypothetical protein
VAKRTKRKDPAAVALGRKGGKATAKNLTPEERTEAAKKAAAARWGAREAKDDDDHGQATGKARPRKKKGR